MDFFTIFYWELCWACGLVFDKQFSWTFQVSFFLWIFVLYQPRRCYSPLFPEFHIIYFILSSCVYLWVWRWWRPLQLYAGFSIIMIYVYQLPLKFSNMFQWVADFISLFKITATSEWPEICSSFSLILFYIMVCKLDRLPECHLYCLSPFVVFALRYCLVLSCYPHYRVNGPTWFPDIH